MGRPAGGSNRNKQFLQNRLKKMFGEDFDPIIKAAESAVEMQKMVDGDLQDESPLVIFNAHKECAATWEKVGQYIQPKLKAVEVTADVEVRPHEDWLNMLEGFDNADE